MNKILFVMLVFGVSMVMAGRTHAAALFPICPPKYANLSPAPVDSNLYKGHCGLYICTDKGTKGIDGCQAIQKAADAQRKIFHCSYVPPYSQCKR